MELTQNPTYNPNPIKYHILTDKFLYCPIPKAACTNFKALILETTTKPHETPYPTPEHLTTQELNKIHETRPTILITRNPLTRILSAYINKFIPKPYYDHWTIYTNPTPFEEFIEYIIQQTPETSDIHWAPIWYLATPHITYTHIIKIENLHHHLPELEKIIGKGPLPNENQINFKRNYAENQINKYYTKKLKQKIQDHYTKDYQDYNYQL